MNLTVKKTKPTQLQEICFYLVNGCLEREIADYQDKIRQYLLNDNDSFKKIIVDALYNCPNLPKDIALQLAHDKFTYAKNILKHYPDFSEDDLITMIHSIDPSKIKYLMAMISRENLPARVLQEIIDTCSYETLLDLLQNQTSTNLVELIAKTINKYPEKPELFELLKKFPEPEMHKAFSLIAPSIAQEIASKLKLKTEPKKLFCKSNILHLNEHNLFTFEEELFLKQNIDQLFVNNCLLPTLIIHYLCKGNLYSFIYSITKITELSFLNIRKICFEEFNEDKFKEIYRYVALPANMYDSIQLLIQIIGQELKTNNMHTANFNFSIKNSIKKHGVAADTQEMRYLLSMM